ncbi:TPR-like protein [Coccomyxa subellipsoidea C-169]|uniref:TPR-like protein n=1 Tax=Coccomyxa subellipsoidea (strain C-169) TaxID=574566 RepID=I0Z682_COCSC|nr:TPR-like protein [Coccomyxa subellipsoidea C-169]EIE26151.1 TPR-like protein [Coccomyxa subellipsoidea C-169]|eukprot:XP_005650695.1 TPR-like protein [Coccomyxa subellipsoidea C-169]
MIAFEGALDISPDHCAAYNLAVMAYALGEPENMKNAFLTLIQVHKAVELDSSAHLQEHEEILEGDDPFTQAGEQVLHAARLIAPAVIAVADPDIAKSGGATSADGWRWCAAALAAAGLRRLAGQLRMAVVAVRMHALEFESAEWALQEFEAEDMGGEVRAAVNLSSLRLLQDQPQEAEASAERALTADSRDTLALTCLGNARTAAGDLEGAKRLYVDALTLDNSSYCAQYNYGLVSKRLGYLEDALSVFRQLHDVTPGSADVMCQVADVLDQKQDYTEAILRLERLHALVPGDAGILAKLAGVHAKLGAVQEAARCLEEAHAAAPTNLAILGSLLDLLMEHKAFERALPVLETASWLQPQEVRWQLTHAWCLRQTRPAPVALAAYQRVHAAHPHNPERLGQSPGGLVNNQVRIQILGAAQQPQPASSRQLAAGRNHIQIRMPPRPLKPDLALQAAPVQSALQDLVSAPAP